MTTTLASETPVSISQKDFDAMLSFARTVFQLKDNPAYLKVLMAELPETARIETAWPSVLMGYDFHLTGDGPKLIEINNNAGGLYIGDRRWMPQPDIAELMGTLEQRLTEMFHADWKTIAIMDEDVTGQFMYPEMLAYAELFKKDGRHVVVVSPEALQLGDDGLFFDGKRIDVIYNRHTDFYLDSEAVADIRKAYERGQVAINPHPRSYALIGDKSRMVDWWREGLLESCVDEKSVDQIRIVTPKTYLLSEVDAEKAWSERKQWVFKPPALHASKGVIIGKSIRRKRFSELVEHSDQMLMQEYVPPHRTTLNEVEFKVDLRLYMHGSRPIAIAARAYKGMVTNFTFEGSGYLPVSVG